MCSFKNAYAAAGRLGHCAADGTNVTGSSLGISLPLSSLRIPVRESMYF